MGGFCSRIKGLKIAYLGIKDPEAGVANVKSEILLNVWDKFNEHDIEIPYPQRDLHIRSSVIDINKSSNSN